MSVREQLKQVEKLIPDRRLLFQLPVPHVQGL